jgi:hypothetical protein
MNFIEKLLGSDTGVSSNRFLGVFVFSPALLFLIFFKYDIEYVYAIIGLITALVVTNAAAKFATHNSSSDTTNKL